jgi:hypothetical protein
MQILFWWASVIYTTVHVNHQKDALISAGLGRPPLRYLS